MKLKNKIVLGQAMPRHIQIAYGRHIFRLLHGGRDVGLWLRDLPASLWDLDYMGHRLALEAYNLEHERTNANPIH